MVANNPHGVDEKDGIGATKPNPTGSNGVEHNIDLERVQTQRSTRSRKEIDPLGEPPDGGWNAWLKVFGCFLLYSNIWGFTISFGAFQTYYQRTLLPTSTPSSISWIGTTQSFLLILIGTLSGPLFDLGYFRPMLVIGNVLILIGVFTLSLCTTYWQVFLSQAICMGLGAGLLYVPSLALVGLAFDRRRAVAQGIVTAGIAVGGVSFTLAFDRISTSQGFGHAVRAMGYIALGICTVAFPALLWGTSKLARPRKARSLIDTAAWRDRGFVVFTGCSFATFLGYIVPYFYIASYAQDVLGASQNTALVILVMGVGASFFGRLVAGGVAHYLGATLTWMCCAVVSGVLCLCWMAVGSVGGLRAFSVLWGFCSAGLVTLPGAVFPSLCHDKLRLGTWMGMSWGVSSFASLIGSPIAGALVRTERDLGTGRMPKRNFLGPQLWAACCLLVGACVIAVLWVHTMRKLKSGYFV